MTLAEHARIGPDQVHRSIDPGLFDFKSTADLPDLAEVLGQERAVRAISFGIDINSPGYHIFALGPAGTGKSSTLKRFLENKAADQPTPDDICYVNNFEAEDQPRLLTLPAGLGHQLADDMDALVTELKNEVPTAFSTEDYEREREEVRQRFRESREELSAKMEREAKEEGFALLQTPQGIVMAPVVDGEVLGPEEFRQLDAEQQAEFEEKQARLQESLRQTMGAVQRLQDDAKEAVRELDQRTVGFAVSHLIDSLKEDYREFDQIIDFLEKVQADILENVKQLKELGSDEEDLPLPLARLQRQREPSFEKYRVNLIVNNADLEGAPVVLEPYPTYYNLLGRVEHEAQFGALVTNFSMIKGGALHRANGGYLIVEAQEILTKPFAWDALKRALKSKEVQIERMGEEHQAISTRTLEPEPMEINVKVIMLGEPQLYYLLFTLDSEFQEVFKVKADFGTHMEADTTTYQLYARFIASICRKESLTHFDPGGVARILEESARMVADKEKLATQFGIIVDLIRESSYWAHRNGNGLVTADDVRTAVHEKIYRSNRLEERIRELIDEGTLLIDTEGEVVGQVNGISVVPLGDYMFGKPTRITARTHVGKQGVVNIERETELGGSLHNKGVMILAGYLGGRYAQDVPLALSASLTFEQEYSGVDGDSASSTELYALLSSLSGFPIRQDIAVTGSVNQHGVVQSIGGINEKVEGFYEVCKLKGLTGSQGVILPRSNVRNLMLREEILEAIKAEKFHLYGVETIDEGIELLTGREAGQPQADGSYPEGSVNAAVQARLRQLAERVRAFSHPEDERAAA